MLKNHLICALGLLLSPLFSVSQFCPGAQGDQVSYGTNNVWIGYIYDNSDFTNYAGYVTAGTASSPDFTENFGGLYVNFPTNGCAVYTETFTARYKLIKTFAAGSYEFTVSGDDAVRFSIDGGSTWLINNWSYNSYMPTSATVNLNGTYNLVIEYLEGAHHNRLYFSVTDACTASGSTTAYGVGNIWNGYMFSGINFNHYKGMVTEGTASTMSFTQNFGGSSVAYPTNTCVVLTDFFSARYRLRHNFASSSYTLTVSADDKYRLSLDGGNTWVIDRWGYDGSYSTRNYVANLNGDYDMVLEYYDKDGDNPLQFSFVKNVVLSIDLLSFGVARTGTGVAVSWKMAATDQEPLHFEIERSDDGRTFQTIGVVDGPANKPQYSYLDQDAIAGTVYYRLKVTDHQNKTVYSRVVSLTQNGGDGVKIFPTMITNNSINIRNDVSLSNAELIIADMNGRNLMKKQLGRMAPNQSMVVYFGEVKLQPGIYLVQLSDGRETIRVEKIFIR